MDSLTAIDCIIDSAAFNAGEQNGICAFARITHNGCGMNIQKGEIDRGSKSPNGGS